MVFDIFSYVKTTSLRLDAHLEENVSSDMLRRRRSPARSQRKEVRKDQSQYWRIQHSWFVYLKILVREKYSLREKGTLGSIHAVNVSKGNWHQIKIRARKGGLIQKCAPHERSPCAPKFGKDLMRRLCTKKDAPAEQRGTSRKVLTSSRIRTKLRFAFLLKQRQCRRLSLRNHLKSENS